MSSHRGNLEEFNSPISEIEKAVLEMMISKLRVLRYNNLKVNLGLLISLLFKVIENKSQDAIAIATELCWDQ